MLEYSSGKRTFEVVKSKLKAINLIIVLAMDTAKKDIKMNTARVKKPPPKLTPKLHQKLVEQYKESSPAKQK
ncbi:hypothetical protein F8M41_003763 [Gigaspora margarita]|uniref:Uncharacterized protein n=1 Tax=Gigaspora margarita TaxID=4874 RepID=A0A8H4A6A2_GIGMA|nr:hypothetical protein F8M41_003763 [Gigaspora margarita]